MAREGPNMLVLRGLGARPSFHRQGFAWSLERSGPGLGWGHSISSRVSAPAGKALADFRLQWSIPMQQPMFSQIRLLIFDLDGTLIDSKTDLVLSVNAMREQIGLARLDPQVVLSYVGQGAATLIRRALGDGASQELLPLASTIFRNHYRRHLLDNTVPYPGVREA